MFIQQIRKSSFSLTKKLLSNFIQRSLRTNHIAKFHKTYSKMSQNMQEFILDTLHTPFEELDCQEAFDGLTEPEKKYLHFYTKVR